jgi:hypothetical protein
MRGYPNENPQQYMYISRPPGGTPGRVGGYGPSTIRYYTPNMPTYPYPLDFSKEVKKVSHINTTHSEDYGRY